MAKMDSKQMRQWALSMYLNENRTQEEIAEACGVARGTIVRWAKADKWKEHKAAKMMTHEEMINNWKEQLIEINDNIASREPSKRFATPSESDTINKLSSAINKLQTELGISEAVTTAQRFIAWLRPVDLDKCKEFTRLFDAFLKSLM